MFVATSNLFNLQTFIGPRIQAASSHRIVKSKKKTCANQSNSTIVASIPLLPSYVDRLTPFTTLLNQDMKLTILPGIRIRKQILDMAVLSHLNQQLTFKRHFRTIQSEKNTTKPDTVELKGLMDTMRKKSTVNDKVNELLKAYAIPQKHATILRLGFEEGLANKESTFNIPHLLLFLIVIPATLFLIFKTYSKSKGFVFSKVVKGVTSDVRFEDIKGIDDSQEELEDIVEYLKDPEKFSQFGAKLPSGVLLVGPPGTGKTLLAKAVAGEAGVPFFYAAGSEFDEMFVGVGAMRVRQLFEQARKESPSIIFIDEIDACGSTRTNSSLQPFARQTINQLLQEMDGFNKKNPVVVIGATNTGKVLDKALTRAGRFDLKVDVLLPDIAGRKAILQLYLDKIEIKLDPSIDLERISSLSAGMTGADMSNVVNQAVLHAIKMNRSVLEQEDLEYALDKSKMGPELKSKTHTEKEIKHTALHEAGHALIAYFTPAAHDIYKATIMQRGPALGHVSFLTARDDENSMSKSQLYAMLDVSMGGRVAEELLLGKENVNTGASADIEMATNTAYQLVCRWGMSEKMGLMHYDVNNLSSETKRVVEMEVKNILEKSNEKAKHILTTYSFEHTLLSNALVRYETLSMQEIRLLMESKDIDSVHNARQKSKMERMRKKLEQSKLGNFGDILPPVVDYIPESAT